MPLRIIYETEDPVEAVFLFCVEEKALSYIREEEGKITGWDFEATDSIKEAANTFKANPDSPVPVSRLVDAIKALKVFRAFAIAEQDDKPSRIRISDEHIWFIRNYIGGCVRYNKKDLKTAIEAKFKISIPDKKLDRWIELAQKDEPFAGNKRKA